MKASVFSLSLTVEVDHERNFVVSAPFLAEPVRASTFEEAYDLALRAFRHAARPLAA